MQLPGGGDVVGAPLYLRLFREGEHCDDDAGARDLFALSAGAGLGREILKNGEYLYFDVRKAAGLCTDTDAPS